MHFMEMNVLQFLIPQHDVKPSFLRIYISVYSRSTLHPQGAHSLEAELHNIATLRGELMATALEALLIKDNDLTGKQGHFRQSDAHIWYHINPPKPLTDPPSDVNDQISSLVLSHKTMLPDCGNAPRKWKEGFNSNQHRFKELMFLPINNTDIEGKDKILCCFKNVSPRLHDLDMS